MSSNTTLSGANIVLLNKAGVIMSNQHHGIVQLGPRQHITELYRYGYNLSNIWSFLGVRVYTINVVLVIQKKSPGLLRKSVQRCDNSLAFALWQAFPLYKSYFVSHLQRPQKGFAQTPTEVAWVSGLPKGIGERSFALSLFRFYLSPFPLKRLQKHNREEN